MGKPKKHKLTSRKIKFRYRNLKDSGETDDDDGFGTRPIPTRYPNNKMVRKSIIKVDDKSRKVNKYEK